MAPLLHGHRAQLAVMLGRNQHVYHVRLLVVNHGLSVLVYRPHVEPGSQGFGLERVLIGDTNNLNVRLLQDERNVNASYVAAADDTYVHPIPPLLTRGKASIELYKLYTMNYIRDFS